MLRKSSKTIGIREAIEYLAFNDEEDLGDDEIGYTTCVTMIAHLFNKEPRDIAKSVQNKRKTTDYY